MNAKIPAVLLGLSLAVLAPGLRAQANYRLAGGPEAAYFGHVSLADVRSDGRDAVILREGSAVPEVAVLNTPIGPGDTLRTTVERRLEVQFDNATILRLDYATELRIGTILARSLSSDRRNVTNFFLARGRVYVMYKEYDSRELFQVLTDVAAVKFRHATVASLAVKNDRSTEVMVEYGRCDVLAGAPPVLPIERAVARNTGLTVLRSGGVAAAAFDPEPGFAAWNRSINESYEALHAGRTPIPKPVLRMTKSVYYFAQTFGNLHGEWLTDEYLGYVWRPADNDHYPSGRWAPYVYGHWIEFADHLYWVPDEVWGWVPYHLGIWQWDAKKGWLWVPGSAFAPAWVDWAICDGGYCLWSPMSIWDWAWSDEFGWDMYGFDDDFFWTESPDIWGEDAKIVPARKVLDSVTKDQLRRPVRPAQEMPVEFARIKKAMVRGLEKNNPEMVESIRGSLGHAVIVRTDDLKAPRLRDKASFLGTILADHGSSRPALGAVRRADPSEILPGEAGRNAARGSVLSPGFGLDWNPDVRNGFRLGLSVQYSSRTNEVFCPEIHISSRFADLASNRFRNDPGASVGVRGDSGSSGSSEYSAAGSSSGSGSSGGSMSVSSSSSGSSSSSSSSSSSTETKTGSGGHIR